jgi:CHAT domain-containing protein
MLGGRSANADQVRRALLPHEAMLEYLVTPTSIITFVVTPAGVRNVAAEASPELLARWVRLARDLAGRPQPIREADQDALVALHGVLIAPAERAGLLRDVERLIIVPHSVLSYLPFAALKRDRSSRFLIEEYTLLHSPSAAALTVVRNEGVRGASTRAEVFAPFPRELPASIREARAFQRSIRSSNATIGRSATEAAFRAALASGGVVHVATHGVMNPRNPMFSRLEFASGTGIPGDDGRLEAHEVLGLRVTAGLVFLSGCETGLGTAGSTQFPRGGDYATLEQAFLFAGARTVIATLWPIADEGAAAFAERFYHHVRRMAPAEALAAAQRELLRGSRYAAPFYWGGYRVVGQSDYLSEAHSSTSAAVSHK